MKIFKGWKWLIILQVSKMCKSSHWKRIMNCVSRFVIFLYAVSLFHFHCCFRRRPPISLVSLNLGLKSPRKLRVIERGMEKEREFTNLFALFLYDYEKSVLFSFGNWLNNAIVRRFFGKPPSDHFICSAAIHLDYLSLSEYIWSWSSKYSIFSETKWDDVAS